MYKEERGGVFPLSLSQQNILNLEKSIPGTSVNNISTTVRIKGNVDFCLLQDSIRLVLKNDASLRTRIVRQEGEYVQYHAPYDREDFQIYDFSDTSSEGIENWENTVTREPMLLEEAPLYRFVLFRDGEGSGGVLVKLHHIIADGWSQIAVCNRIGQTYLELLEGKNVSLTPAPDYELYVEDEQKYLASAAYRKDEAYWKKILEASGEPSVIKTVNSAAVSPVGRRKSFELPQILNHAIYSYCQEKRVAPFAVFYMALAIYFKRIGGADRFTIGVPIFNRTNYKFRQSTGMFVTTLPFYNEINDEWTLNQFNESLMETWYEMLRHQRYPFSRIAAMAEGDSRLFHIALSYQDSKIYESRDASVMLSGKWHYCGYQAEQLTIHLTNLWNHQQYEVDYDYLAQYFSEEEIVTLHRNLCDILHEVLNDPDKPIYRLRVLSLEEKEKLLYTFNRTERFIEEKPLYEALVWNSREYQNRVAVICEGERVTYGAFLYKSASFACALAKCDVEAEDLVALLLPRKTELLAAMVGSLQAGCGYLVLSEELPAERIRKILVSGNVKVLITTEKGRRRISGSGIPGDDGNLADLSILCAEEVSESGDVFYIGSKEKEKGKIPLDQRLAYVVYTSGSTGEPKGVEITHSNLLNLAQEMKDIYGQGAVLSVCNVGFDAFMLESIVALLNGRTIVLPTEEDLESPDSLAALINGHAVGFLSMTPSRLSALMQSKAFQRSLRKLESIVCGGEAFPAELLQKLKKYCNARIYNQYGPSETTVGVSVKELSHADRITAGRPMGNCKLYVLDKWMNPLPAGGYGNLYIGGKCVGRGYRNEPEMTGKYFLKNPFVTDDKIYFTGDIASWTPDGEILLRGRMDRQVKLRGLRVELQEVASCIEAYPGVEAAAAKVCEIGGQQILGAYYCASEEIGESRLLAHTATYLPRYMIPSFIMYLEKLPVNANGKIDEKKLPLPDMSEASAPGLVTRTAEAVLEVFRTVLKREDISGNTDYFLAGGNSLNAMECIMAIEEQFGRKLRIADLYACRTAVKVADFLDGDKTAATVSAEKKKTHTLSKAPKQQEYELSSIQQGIYIQALLDPTGVSYNMPGAFMMEEEPDRDRLEKAFETLIREDAILRTSFVQTSRGICAKVEEHTDFALEELTGDSFDEACRNFLRPFDLTRAPLLRAALWQDENGTWYLFLDSHHIIGDGMSTPLILKRLEQAYQEGSVKTEWDYYDYLHTVDIQKKEDRKKQELAYWKEHLAELPEALILPADEGRPKKFDYKGNTFECFLTEKESEDIDAFCREKGVSCFVLFLAAYGVLLSEISGRDDFVIGAPVAGRTLPEAAQICGPFINTLPLRLQPGRDLKVSEWLTKVQEEVTGMLDHQQVSLEEIIGELQLARGEQNALYQVMLTQSPVDEDAFVLNGKKMEYRPIDTGAVKMDMILEIKQKSNRHGLGFSYASGIFREETIGLYSRCFRQILSQLQKYSDKCLHQLEVLGRQDYQRYIEIPNYETTPFVNLPVHKLLHQKSAAMADETAIIFHGQKTTYEQLERRACAIAAFLEEKGAQPGQCVGLCLTRTPDMIAAMYGVLKAGCSYVFMLPSFPAARLSYMLEISGAVLMLYDKESREMLPEGFLVSGLCCETDHLPEGELSEYRDRPVNGENLVNVLFTSGSTGKPKGVMLRHRSISNLYSQMKTVLDPVEGNVLCSTNSVFDCFVVETLIALALGRCVVLADEEEMMLPWKLAELVSTYDTGIFEMTPSRLQMCLGNEAFCQAAKHIRIVLLGGEVVTSALSHLFYAHSDGVLMNMYGPTEATVFTTMGPVRPGEHITIGRPLQNTRTYVLDEQLRPVMPTACGEMYIAGECLAAGYVNRPELTESSFVEDIYFPGEKMYRTGDLVRLRADGEFDYVSRKDHQVKLNGQRVELGEITGAILETEKTVQAATVALRKDDGSMELCSFYETVQGEDLREEIMEHLHRQLPVYMIPSRLILLEHIPVTATNKIDMQALKKIASEGTHNVVSAEAARTEAVPVFPQKETEPEPVKEEKRSFTDPDEAYVLSVWNKVLSVPVTDPGASFFAQGGTSMAALNVLSFYYNDSLEMALSDFYEYPTAAGQAEFLKKKYAAAATETQEKETQETEIHEKETTGLPAASGTEASEGDTQGLRIEWSLAEETVKERSSKAVLVTGATGFFGAHLVKELLEEKRQVICLLRDGDLRRLQKCLTGYFGKETVSAGREYLKAVKGDISLKRLGMDDRDYVLLGSRIGEIYHCAADVRHYASDEESYLRTNVDGTANMLELARVAEAVFYHMSTLSVSGELLKDGSGHREFTEMDYDIGQIWEENIYVKSKFLAEGLVLQAAREGLEAKIFRLGRLVGRASDGMFQKNPGSNAFYLLVRGFGQIGALPETAVDTATDLMPVDIAAKEVMALREGNGRIYHIMNNNPPALGEVLGELYPGMKIVSEEVFSGILNEKTEKLDRELVAMVMNNWQIFRNALPVITVTNELTAKQLAEWGMEQNIPSAKLILKKFI